MRTSQIKLAAELWERGIPSRDIAYTLGVGHKTLLRFTAEHREAFPLRRHGAEWWAERLAPYEGIPSERVGRMLGVTGSTVRSWRRRLDG